MSAIQRGLKNPFRNKVRTMVVLLLLSVVIGLFAVMVQAAFQTQEQLEHLQAHLRTLIELREAGAFGTGGFGGDKPVGAEEFSVATLEMIKQIANANHITKVDEYVHAPQIDATKPNAYAMVIGLRPEAPMRAIGEVDYENAKIVAGRGLKQKDAGENVAVVGRLYAKERIGINGEMDASALNGKTITLKGDPLQIVGVYATGNDFGDNHVFIPLETFRRIYEPGDKLSKIRVTVDSVANVEAVAADLKRIPGVDVVTAAEQVSTAKTTLGTMTAATAYGSILLFIIGGVLVVFIMVLTTRERIREIGTLKALGASNLEITKQFLAEVAALIVIAGVGAVLVAALSLEVFQRTLGLTMTLDRNTFVLIILGGFAFASIGSLYPIIKAVRLSPVEAMKSN
ncbi:MAG: ABC transporter permease [Deltaproteobacteria bacterium]|nr:ABC transporter permease [Deltaproteobacteria bacterium]